VTKGVGISLGQSFVSSTQSVFLRVSYKWRNKTMWNL